MEIRRSPQGRSSKDLESLAKRVGRDKKTLTGKEPTWIREENPELSPPLSIPHHSKDMPPGTARSILDILISDCDDWEFLLDEQEEDGND